MSLTKRRLAALKQHAAAKAAGMEFPLLSLISKRLKVLASGNGLSKSVLDPKYCNSKEVNAEIARLIGPEVKQHGGYQTLTFDTPWVHDIMEQYIARVRAGHGAKQQLEAVQAHPKQNNTETQQNMGELEHTLARLTNLKSAYDNVVLEKRQLEKELKQQKREHASLVASITLPSGKAISEATLHKLMDCFVRNGNRVPTATGSQLKSLEKNATKQLKKIETLQGQHQEWRNAKRRAGRTIDSLSHKVVELRHDITIQDQYNVEEVKQLHKLIAADHQCIGLLNTSLAGYQAELDKLRPDRLS